MKDYFLENYGDEMEDSLICGDETFNINMEEWKDNSAFENTIEKMIKDSHPTPHYTN